ncbi:MAG: hypothetical protein QOI39_691, partial [Mycobacterium sp.]|nr:hypothetical protein [Mycobacterium sp.]
WPQYRRVQRGIAGFSFWLDEHLQQLRRTPGDDLMSQLIQKAESGSEETYLDELELRAVASLRDGVEQTAVSLLDELSREPGVVDIVDRYCAQLPVAIISDILGVPDRDRRHVLEFGELAAPSLDFGLTWPQYRRVQRGIAGFSSGSMSICSSCAGLPATT